VSRKTAGLEDQAGIACNLSLGISWTRTVGP